MTAKTRSSERARRRKAPQRLTDTGKAGEIPLKTTGGKAGRRADRRQPRPALQRSSGTRRCGRGCGGRARRDPRSTSRSSGSTRNSGWPLRTTTPVSLHEHLGDGAGERRVDLVEHLHHFDDVERLALLEVAPTSTNGGSVRRLAVPVERRPSPRRSRRSAPTGGGTSTFLHRLLQRRIVQALGDDRRQVVAEREIVEAGPGADQRHEREDLEAELVAEVARRGRAATGRRRCRTPGALPRSADRVSAHVRSRRRSVLRRARRRRRARCRAARGRGPRSRSAAARCPSSTMSSRR